nr:uncharacterized protein LOC131279947 isoform X2 [Dasypus novemcinctus]
MAAQVSRCELQRLHAALDCSGALVVSPSCRAPRWSTALATACQKDAALAPAFRGHVGTPSASRSGLSSHCWKAASIAGAPCRPGPQVLAPDCLCQGLACGRARNPGQKICCAGSAVASGSFCPRHGSRLLLDFAYPSSHGGCPCPQAVGVRQQEILERVPLPDHPEAGRESTQAAAVACALPPGSPRAEASRGGHCQEGPCLC